MFPEHLAPGRFLLSTRDAVTALAYHPFPLEIPMRITLFCALLLASAVAFAEDASLYNTEIYESPWKGEASSTGVFSVRHEGQGDPPEQGYFKEHERGEVAEFHLFVPDGLDPARKYPLLIVYHGGKDGASGKGMCKRFAKLSTKEHPVIVLSPNMYTMDAYNELIADGSVPIDPHRVVVYGHSSGGMGVRSAMAEFTHTDAAFVPAALISSSTTASLGRTKYPPCPYFVMAGEKETPAFVTNEILKDRRRTCRIHALTMQQVFADVRYVEVQGSGHAGGTPAHAAVIQHAIAVSERAPVAPPVKSTRPETEALVAAANAGAWLDVREPLERLGDAAERRTILAALDRWIAAEVEAIAAVARDASYVERDRAFVRYDRCLAIAQAFDKQAMVRKPLANARHWRAELSAREAYRKIVSASPGAAMREPLEKLRREAADTEYGRNRTREKLMALGAIQQQTRPEDLPDGPKIQNPYYPNAKWRVWRDDDTPVEQVASMVRKGKDKVPTEITLAATPVAKRTYPNGALVEGKPIKWTTLATPSKRFSGVWDDVYASWSGLHGYVRPTYQTTDGSSVHLRPKGVDHIMHFVEMRKTNDLLRCGINFVHQSTTGMSHTITNGYSEQMTTSYERIYFSDCLVTSPAHASYTEEWPDRTKDMILALVPTLFNSVGSSNSETMAITKMMIAGGYLPPESKLTLKREGLYPSALLYMWKASLPFEVPYDHELRHRVAYRALGDERQFRGKYGHAGPERGNLSLAYHRYDEVAHMRSMIRMAESMTVLPPEAILDDIEVEGGTSRYLAKKTALILQAKGEDVTVRVSAAKSYDLADRPLDVRWKLLYGNRATTCVPGEAPWVIRVPWDEALPEGRTAIALIVNNGVHDGNPAIVNVYRKRGDLPPPGAGSGGYRYNSAHANRRPVLLGLQDQIVKPGKTVRITLDAVDPEGQPVRYFKRAGEPGEIEGNLYTLKMPRGKSAQTVAATIIASDGTAGNSYAAKRVEFVVAPRVFAHIEAKQLVGAAPFTVEVSSKGSLPARGKVERGWEFYSPAPKRKPVAWKQMAHEATATHTFKKAGLYEVALTVKSGERTDRETVQVWVTDGPPPKPVGGAVVEGNGVRIPSGDNEPCVFDHTRFGSVRDGTRKRRRFVLINRSGAKLGVSSKALTIEGAQAKEFRLVKRPANRVSPLGSTPFEIEFRPKGTGPRTAQVTLKLGTDTIRFAIAGTGVAK